MPGFHRSDNQRPICLHGRDRKSVTGKHGSHSRVDTIPTKTLWPTAQHALKLSCVTLGIAHWPQRLRCDSPFALHEAVQQAIKRKFAETAMYRHWDVYGHRLILADPVDTVVTLFFHSRVPPTRQMNDMGRGGQRQPCPSPDPLTPEPFSTRVEE
jgi:hypothetical protein